VGGDSVVDQPNSQMFLFAIVKIPAATGGREQRTGVPLMSHWVLVHSTFITVKKICKEN
jgi:hypothetical protein